jgi:hypothetical protein
LILKEREEKKKAYHQLKGSRHSDDRAHHAHHPGDHAQQTPGDAHTCEYVRGAIVYTERVGEKTLNMVSFLFFFLPQEWGRFGHLPALSAASNDMRISETNTARAPSAPERIPLFFSVAWW